MAPKASSSRTNGAYTRNVLPGNFKNKKHQSSTRNHSVKAIHLTKASKAAKHMEVHSPTSVVFGDTRIYAGYARPIEEVVQENRFVIPNIPENVHIFGQQRRRSHDSMYDVLREVRTEVLVRKLSVSSDDVEVDETEMFLLN